MAAAPCKKVRRLMARATIHLGSAGTSTGGLVSSAMSLYALNLFDLADNHDYLACSKRSVAAVGKYGGTVVALGRLDAGASPEPGDTHPRQVMVLVEWPDRAAFEAF